MSKKDKNPPDLFNEVISAVKNLKETRGSTVTKILGFVKTVIQFEKRNGGFRNLSTVVKKALLHGVQEGHLTLNAGRYKLSPPRAPKKTDREDPDSESSETSPSTHTPTSPSPSRSPSSLSPSPTSPSPSPSPPTSTSPSPSTDDDSDQKDQAVKSRKKRALRNDIRIRSRSRSGRSRYHRLSVPGTSHGSGRNGSSTLEPGPAQNSTEEVMPSTSQTVQRRQSKRLIKSACNAASSSRTDATTMNVEINPPNCGSQNCICNSKAQTNDCDLANNEEQDNI